MTELWLYVLAGSGFGFGLGNFLIGILDRRMMFRLARKAGVSLWE